MILIQVWFQNRRAKFRKQQRQLQASCGEQTGPDSPKPILPLFLRQPTADVSLKARGRNVDDDQKENKNNCNCISSSLEKLNAFQEKSRGLCGLNSFSKENSSIRAWNLTNPIFNPPDTTHSSIIREFICFHLGEQNLDPNKKKSKILRPWLSQ